MSIYDVDGNKNNKKIEFSLGEALGRHGVSVLAAGIYRRGWLLSGMGLKGTLAAGWTRKVYSSLRESDPPHKHIPCSPLINTMELYLLLQQAFYIMGMNNNI